MKNKKQKTQISLIKNATMKLNYNKQLPFALVQQIMKLTGNEKNEHIIFLKELTAHYLRVKGYYKMFASAEKQANTDIKGLLLEKGYYID